MDVRAVVEIEEGEHWRRLNPEDHHEEEETDSAMHSTHSGDLCEEEQERRRFCKDKKMMKYTKANTPWGYARRLATGQ